MKVQLVPVTKLRLAEWDARLDDSDEEIAELAQSIAELGLLNPPSVIENDDGYTVIAGRRRFKACKQLGLAEIHVNVLELTGQDLDAASLVENIQRRGLNAVEECLAFDTFLEHHGVTQEELGQRIGKSREYVAKRLMLRNLDEPTIRALHTGQISLSVAIELKRIEDVAMRQYYLSHAINYGASTSVVKVWVDNYLKEGDAATRAQFQSQGGESGYVPPSIFFTCFACGGSFEPQQVKSVWLCSEDAHALHMATRPQER